MIAQPTDQFAVADLCHALGVSRSGDYAWRNRAAGGDELTAPVAQVFWRHSRRYGARRIVAELQAQGCQSGRRRVRRSLREQQLQAIQPKRFVPKTTDSRHGLRMSPNLLGGLEISRPRQVFVSDITYLPLHSGQWAYEGDLAGLVLAQDRRLASRRQDDGGVGDRRAAPSDRAGVPAAGLDRAP